MSDDDCGDDDELDHDVLLGWLLVLEALDAEEPLVLGVVVHEQASVVGDEVVADLEVVALRDDARLPSDAVDDESSGQVLVT